MLYSEYIDKNELKLINEFELEYIFGKISQKNILKQINKNQSLYKIYKGNNFIGFCFERKSRFSIEINELVVLLIETKKNFLLEVIDALLKERLLKGNIDDLIFISKENIEKYKLLGILRKEYKEQNYNLYKLEEV